MSKKALRVAAVAAGALLMAASAPAVEILVGENTGDPGTTVSVDVTLATDGEDVAGTQNDIQTSGDSGISIAARTQGTRQVPDCTANAEIDKGGTSFAFQPPNCVPGDTCTGVRALVLSLSNVDPIPDGSVLYSCNIAIASSATAGDKTLSNLNFGSSDPSGNALVTTGVDGRVIVSGGAADATVVLGSASGDAGDTVSIDVSLNTGTDVAGTQNDITVAAPLAIAARTQGTRQVPDCTANGDIDKGGTSFAFQPPNCTPGENCTGVRALVLSLSNVDPIPDGSVLYSCNIAIAGDADNGDYPLTCSNPGASDPAGGALNTACTNGTITVGGEVPPTSTPTETPSGEVTPTNTPEATATNTAVATATWTIRPPITPTGNDDDGCAVVAPAEANSGWLLLLPAAALLWLRRRSR